jgi:Mannosyltransferase (PIG-V)
VDAATSQAQLDGADAGVFRRIRSLVPHKALVGAIVTSFGGISAGAFVWYVLATRNGGANASSELLLTACVGGSLIGTLGVWIAFSQWASHAFDVDYASMLQIDSYIFLPLSALWFYLFQVPPTLSSAAAVGLTVLLISFAVTIGILARYSVMIRAVSVVFAATRVPLMLIAPLAAIVIGQRQGHHFSPEHGVLLDVWGRWDAEHYLSIAAQGYHGNDVAFFPLYPFAIHVLGALVGDHLIAGLLISNLAFFAALGYLYALAKLEFGEHAAAFHAIFYIAIFPTAIFFSAVYTESLFLLLTVASVYYARRGNYITAGVFGALASMTRVEGVLTALPLAYEVWRGWVERRGTTLARGIVGLALVPAGLFAYMFYLYALQGDPMAFSHVQATWNRYLAPPWTSVITRCTPSSPDRSRARRSTTSSSSRSPSGFSCCW